MRSMGIRVLGATGLALALTGCGGKWNGTAYTYLTVTNPSDGTPMPLQVQVAEPAESVPPMENGLYPAIVFIHGGAWAVGNRFGMLNDEIMTAASKGYVAVSVDFRNAQMVQRDGPDQNLNAWPTPLQDVKCAVRWLKHNAAEFNVDPTKIGVWGESSGGHLALMTAQTPSVAEFEHADCPYPEGSAISSAVTFAAVADLVTTWRNGGVLRYNLKNLVNAQDPDGSEFYDYEQLLPETRATLEQASPINWVDNADVPIMLIHARNDSLVFANNSINFHQFLINASHTDTMLRLDRGDHFYGDTSGKEARAYSDTQKYKWFDHTLKGESVDLPCDFGTRCDVTVPAL